MHVLPDSIQFNSNLSITLRSFLRALAHHCGDKITCWPSQKRIAAFVGCSVRTVRRMERQALELQLISVRRRWLKSNVYTVLCLVERQLSTMGTQGCPVEKNTSEFNKRLKTAFEQGPKPWTEVKALMGDICQIMGESLSSRNRGWFLTISRKCSWDHVQACLSQVRQSMLEGDIAGEPIRNPSGLLTWLLRKEGAPI